MSHVVDVDVQIKDIDALKEACKERGLELVQKSTYRWYGRHVGDWPMPTGFTRADLGKCEYAIRVPGADSDTYEIGVVRRRDGKEGYTFMYDFFNAGYGLVRKMFGEDNVEEFAKWNAKQDEGNTPLRPILKEYEAQLALKVAKKQYEGWEVSRVREAGVTKVRIREKGAPL